MKEINDGGPAFPRTGNEYVTGGEGMSLRDWFAGQLLSGLVGKTVGPDQAAEYAYITADAMIAARNKPTE